jgi:glyoxylase-like metal-dependent hydrolase (beta-lactamase superfamily II)
MKFGEFEIHAFVEQKFKLDGGAMFGVVPKVIWKRMVAADKYNLIPMATNIFVLRAHGKIMMFDAGLGDTLSDQERLVYGTEGVSRMDSALSESGRKRDDVDYVILTHLHTDHAGGAVCRAEGEYRPRFRNARYLVSRVEWDVAMNPDERTAAVYIPERLSALAKSGQVDFIEVGSELFKGIRTVHTGGHTEGHFALEIESNGTKVFYYADILPTANHLRVPYVPAADLFPVETMEVKRRLLPRIVDQDVVVAFDHDVDAPLARIKQAGGRLVAEPVVLGSAEYQNETG